MLLYEFLIAGPLFCVCFLGFVVALEGEGMVWGVSTGSFVDFLDGSEDGGGFEHRSLDFFVVSRGGRSG